MVGVEGAVGVVVYVGVVAGVVVAVGVGVGGVVEFVAVVSVGDVAMNQAELLEVLSDVLELGEPVPLALVPLLHALQAEDMHVRPFCGALSFGSDLCSLSFSGRVFIFRSSMGFSRDDAWPGSVAVPMGGPQPLG